MYGRRLNFFINKDRKSLYIIFAIVLVSVFTLTVAYAALNTVLNITGNAEVIASSWNIHLDNVNVKSGSVGGVAPKITSPTTATFSTKLTTPGDFYEFSIDVVNDGSIDAMIDGVTKTPTLTSEQAKYLNYIVEYENGNAISTKQLVKVDSFVRLKVKVEFRKDLTASDLPKQSETLNLSFTVNYVQSDNTGSSVLNNGTLKAMVKSGIGTNVGDEICIGNECFYVISSTDTDVTMLAKYNLLVGNKYDDVNGAVSLENSTGIQDENAKGWFDGYSIDNPIIGTKSFSSTAYWSSTVSIYPSYIYNENSYLYEYVENYKSYLENMGTIIKDARLISLEELESLGCSRTNYSCTSAPSWVNSITYWTGSAFSFSDVWHVPNNGNLDYSQYTRDYRGVRPVITISKEQILGIKSSFKPVANGSLDDIGTIVTIGSEQFYTIGTEGDNVKLLAKYNLLVGNKYDDTNKAVLLSNSTGIQSESAVGWFDGYTIEKPLIGTKTFSSTNYWSSTVSSYPSYVYNEKSYLYEYVENYKDYLEKLSTVVAEARLITFEELEALGCNISTNRCYDAPSWIYSTTYWSGSANSSTDMWGISNACFFNNDTHYTNPVYGVRPVIIISKSLF